jgi:hypothetical protein
MARRRRGIELFLVSGVLTRSRKTEKANELIEGDLSIALADQVDGPVILWKTKQEELSHLNVEVELCEIKRWADIQLSLVRRTE